MITLISICDFFWWLWLLPFLLGALITWLYWRNKYANMVADYDGEIKGLNGRINGLQEDLAECASKRTDLEGDLAITKGRMREIEANMKALKSSADSGKKGGKGSKGKDGNTNISALSTDSTNKTGSENDSGSKNLETPRGNRNSGSGDADISNVTSSLTGDAITNGGGNDANDHKSINIGNADSGNTNSGGNDKRESSDESNSESDSRDDRNSNEGNSNANLGNVVSSLAGNETTGLTSKGVSGNDDSADNSSSSSGSSKKSIYRGLKSDNLQIIEGIGPKMESVLKENGVSSHSDLAEQSPDSLQAILGKYGDKYKIIDPTTWAQQAGYAARGDYDGMIDLQKKLDTGKDNAAGITASKLEKYLVKSGALKAFKQDDLKAIEGIGPATEKLLHGSDIKTWRDLANTEASAIKAILSAAGSRFALGDPTTWPKQAELAADGKFDELREYQDFLDGGRA